ncbi:putative reverse transcriptase zinc-binding domain-containing protein [Helianthus anomalus]
MNLRRILRCFYLASGLKVNLSKCSLYGVGVEEPDVVCLANTLQCNAGVLPFKYLGLYVGANMNLVRNWKPIVDLFKSRLSIWKAKKLSYGGRITLLKSVLSSLPTYFFSLYRAPVQVLNQLERIRRIFFWGGSEEVSKMAWMAWENVVVPVEYGGLGFGSLRDANLAMLAKWWWRFKTEKDGLWRRVIWSIHNNSRSWNTIPAKISIAGPWKQIYGICSTLLRLGIDISKAIKGVARSGTEVAFWVDNWVAPEPLQFLFPHLFQLEKHKGCLVAERAHSAPYGTVWGWDWRRQPASAEEISEFQQLNILLQGVSVSTGPDVWVWNLDRSGQFNVGSIKSSITELNRVRPGYVVKWNGWTPKKVGMVAWRAHNERLPTRVALSRRGVAVQSLECPICGEYNETSEHLLVSCGFAQTVWSVVYQWCKAQPVLAFSLKDILDSHEEFDGSAKKKKAYHAVCLVTFWSLWNNRSELMFLGTRKSITSTVEEIKTKSFLWIKHRSKEVSMTWDQWQCFDVF